MINQLFQFFDKLTIHYVKVDETYFNRKLYTLTHPGNTSSCWKPPINEKSNDTARQEPTYQELNIQKN